MESKTITITPTLKPDMGQYSSGQFILLGKLKVARYFYNGMRSKDDPKVYRVEGLIPTIKSHITDVETEAEAIAVLEQVANVVIKQLSI
jgi:hypothetical protein